MQYLTILGKTKHNNSDYFIVKNRFITPFLSEDVREVSRNDLLGALRNRTVDIDNYRLDSSGTRIIKENRVDFEVQEQLSRMVRNLMTKYEYACRLKWYGTFTKNEMQAYKIKAGCVLEIEGLFDYVKYTVYYNKNNTFLVSGLISHVSIQRFNTIDEVSNAIECGILTHFVNSKRNVVSEEKMFANIKNLADFAHDFLNGNTTLCSSDTLCKLNCSTLRYLLETKEETENGKYKYRVDIDVWNSEDKSKKVIISVRTCIDGLYKISVNDVYSDSYDSNDIGDIWKYIKTIVQYKLRK